MYPFNDRQKTRFSDGHLKQELLIGIGESDANDQPRMYFSTLGIRYPWGAGNNTVREWEPAIQGVDPLRLEIPHVPALQPSGTGLRRTLRFRLLNRQDSEGVYLLDRLESVLSVVELKRVFLAELALTPGDRREEGIDLSHLNVQAGTSDDIAHVIRFRGYIRTWRLRSQELIEFDCVADLVDAENFPMFLNEADPRHWGQRSTEVYGRQVEFVPGLNARVPNTLRGEPSEYATLLENLPSTQTSGTVSMTIPARDAWPDSGEIRIGREQIAYSAIAESVAFQDRPDSYDVTISARAQTSTLGNPTVAEDHNTTDLVSRRTDIDAIEGWELVVIFAAEIVFGVQGIWCTDASDGFVRRAIGTDLVSTTLNDVNGEAIGWPASVARWDLRGLGELLRDLARQAQVTQQPQFVTEAAPPEVRSSIVTPSVRADQNNPQADKGDWTTLIPEWKSDDASNRREMVMFWNDADIVGGRDPGDTEQECRDATLIGYRLVWVAEAEVARQDAINDMELRYFPRNIPPFQGTSDVVDWPSGFWDEDEDTPAGPFERERKTPRSGWAQGFGTGATVQDLIDANPGVRMRVNWDEDPKASPALPEVRMVTTKWGLEYRYQIGATVEGPDVPTEIFARGDSIDYRFFATVDGIFNATFTAARSKPREIFEQVIESAWQASGEGGGSFIVSDESGPTLGSGTSRWDDFETNTTGQDLDILPMEYGTTLETQLAGMAFQARAQFITVERERSVSADPGMRLVPLASLPQEPTGEYKFPDPIITIDQYDTVSFEGQDSDSIYTGFVALYDQNRVIRQGDQGYRRAFRHQRIGGTNYSDFDVSPADLNTIVGKYGLRNSPTFTFLGIGPPLDSSDKTIQDVFGYYVHELSRGGKAWSVISVPWVQHAQLELGDTFWLDLSAVFGGSTVLKCRCIGIVRRFDSGMADITGVEVL